MKGLSRWILVGWFVMTGLLVGPGSGRAAVKAWEGTITIPTYPWADDVNPKFWALEGGPKLSTTVHGAIVYPYTMQDHLFRNKVDRTYQALFLENEYLKITCLPELGGRLHSILDKTEGKETFHLNRVIKPGMIAMRGAWISGGVEWNSGPHGHTVTILSPVDALLGSNPDGSAYIEVNNQEKIFRTRWTVRVTLHPGKAYLDERIRVCNPTDGMHPYYFWNCTAFPNRPGTRFIYPMSLGTDHNFRKFFNWPVHEGKDLSWLKNYLRYSSIFAVGCDYDFFGAYDVDDDRGIVQVANHHELPGKKAWTWGTWDFGLVSQQNLTDDDGPYIEVQSGPLPTQSDYGMLAPREAVHWREFWYPVHGLGDGFEFANRDLAAQISRGDGELKLRLIATGRFPDAKCTVSAKDRRLLETAVDLSPKAPQVITVSPAPDSPAEITVQSQGGAVLARFITPLPIRKVTPPKPASYVDKPDDQLTLQEKYLKGDKFDRDTNRRRAREYYEMALQEDPGHAPSLRALAVLDIEAGLYEAAISRLEQALQRDPSDGLSWYFLGASHLKLGNEAQALTCGYQAAKRFGTDSLGYDLAGRAHMRLRQFGHAVDAFSRAHRRNPGDAQAEAHLELALYASGRKEEALRRAEIMIRRDPTTLIPRLLVALHDEAQPERCVAEMARFLGEGEFELLEASLTLAELGLVKDAARLLAVMCAVPIDAETARGAGKNHPLLSYYAAYFHSQSGDEVRAKRYLDSAAGHHRDFVFPSRPEAVPVLKFAVEANPEDAAARLHLGNLLANLGRVDEAIPCWRRAAELDPKLSMAWRNLGLSVSVRDNNLAEAAALHRKAISARPGDQTLYRDLAEILIADGKCPQAIEMLAKMPFEKMRRADITIMLAQAYLGENRHTDCIDVLKSTPYFVNWEGQQITWVLFNSAHIKRGRARLDQEDFHGALQDFEAALTYPENLGVGRPDTPEEAPAQFWKGKALEALQRPEQARAAWKAGAAGHEGSPTQNEYRQRCRDALAAGA